MPISRQTLESFLSQYLAVPGRAGIESFVTVTPSGRLEVRLSAITRATVEVPVSVDNEPALRAVAFAVDRFNRRINSGEGHYPPPLPSHEDELVPGTFHGAYAFPSESVSAGTILSVTRSVDAPLARPRYLTPNEPKQKGGAITSTLWSHLEEDWALA